MVTWWWRKRINTLLYIAAVLSLTGCIVTLTPHPHRFKSICPPPPRPYQHCVRPVVCPVPVVPVAPMPKPDGGDSVTIVTPTEVLPKAIQGIAALCCKTQAFQDETGEDAATSLADYTHWPEIQESELDAGAFTAPMCFVTYDAGLDLTLLTKSQFNLGEGEFLMQLALVENNNTDPRYRFIDVANRHGKIMREMQDLARTSTNWWMTGFSVPREIAQNDATRFPFVDGDSNPVTVRIFPTIVTWRG